MKDTLRVLYDCFYKRPYYSKLEKEIEDCHRQLIERLDKDERKLVLRIIDDKDLIAGRVSEDSFICGFQLAWKLIHELIFYKTDGRSNG